MLKIPCQFFFPNNHHFCKGKFLININKNDDDDNDDNDDDQIHREKFLKKKKNNQEKDIKMIRKIKILKSSLPTISITSGTSFQHE